MFPNRTRMTRVERTTMHAAAAVSETERMDISKEFDDPSNTEHKKVVFILRRFSSFFLAWLSDCRINFSLYLNVTTTSALIITCKNVLI